MQKRRSLNVDMLHGPILKTLIVFTIPIVLSNWLQILFNGADLLVIGRFDSDEALAAVGLTTPIVRMLVGFFTGISVGVNVVVARAVGAGDKELQHDAVHTAITFRIIYLNTIFQWYHTQFVLFLSFPIGQALTAAGQLVCHYITGKRLPDKRTVNVKTA